MTIPSSTFLLLSTLGLSASRYWSLTDAFGSPDQVLSTPLQTLLTTAAAQSGFNQTAKHLLQDYQHKLAQQRPECSELIQQGQATIAELKHYQGTAVCVDEEDYPLLLKETYRPPPILYIKGECANLHLPQIAIVGSRHASHGGHHNTRAFAQHLAASGFTITSGLALGVDGSAHQAALDAGGKTIAVMATGIDSIYPKRHHALAENIVANGGTLVSEFTLATPPRAAHFPQRNRIISGLSLGVLVVEAALKSGSLITANCALEQNREVFAIPGSIHNPQSKGCHQLIKNGAILAETSADIIEHLHAGISQLGATLQIDHPATPLNTSTLSAKEKELMACIGFDTKNTDELLQSTQLASHELACLLIDLEIKGWIKQSRWGYERIEP